MILVSRAAVRICVRTYSGALTTFHGISAHSPLTTPEIPFPLAGMNNCQAEHQHCAPSNDVAPSETLRPYSQTLPDRARWPNTRRALVLWTQEHLDRELAKMPTRTEWFDVALSAHLQHEGQR
jgi:hypothetical protein